MCGALVAYFSSEIDYITSDDKPGTNNKQEGEERKKRKIEIIEDRVSIT